MAGSHDFNNSLKELSDRFVKDEVNRLQDLMKHDKLTGGNKLNKKLWPKKYQYKYQISNLWRYGIGSHRLLYTITTIRIVRYIIT